MCGPAPRDKLQSCFDIDNNHDAGVGNVAKYQVATRSARSPLYTQSIRALAKHEADHTVHQRVEDPIPENSAVEVATRLKHISHSCLYSGSFHAVVSYQIEIG